MGKEKLKKKNLYYASSKELDFNHWKELLWEYTKWNCNLDRPDLFPEIDIENPELLHGEYLYLRANRDYEKFLKSIEKLISKHDFVNRFNGPEVNSFLNSLKSMNSYFLSSTYVQQYKNKKGANPAYGLYLRHVIIGIEWAIGDRRRIEAFAAALNEIKSRVHMLDYNGDFLPKHGQVNNPTTEWINNMKSSTYETLKKLGLDTSEQEEEDKKLLEKNGDKTPLEIFEKKFPKFKNKLDIIKKVKK